MIYKKPTTKSVDRAFEDVQAALKAADSACCTATTSERRWPTRALTCPTHVWCWRYCNPRQAAEVLAIDMSLNMALPCRLSIYEDHGKTFIGMVPPGAQLSLISENAQIPPRWRKRWSWH